MQTSRSQANIFGESMDLVQPFRAAPWVKVAPLVLIHDGGGTIFSYHCLGNLDRPVYGIANPHFDSTTPHHWEDGLPGMARHYVKLIRSSIPSGKLILGGWSLGGLLSLEVARQLASDCPAINVIGIVMIDSVHPVATPSQTQFLNIASRTIEWSPTTRQETRDKVMRCFGQSSEMVGRWTLPSWDDDKDDSGDIYGYTFNTRKARPPPVILLRAKEPVPVEGEGVSRVDIHRQDEKLGWGQYREDFITQVVELPGHHFNIFAAQHLDEATDKIKKACKDIERMAV